MFVIIQNCLSCVIIGDQCIDTPAVQGCHYGFDFIASRGNGNGIGNLFQIIDGRGDDSVIQPVPVITPVFFDKIYVYICAEAVF